MHEIPGHVRTSTGVYWSRPCRRRRARSRTASEFVFQNLLSPREVASDRSRGKAGSGVRPEVAKLCRANRTPTTLGSACSRSPSQSLNALTECDPPCNSFYVIAYCGTSSSSSIWLRTPAPVPFPRTLRDATFVSCDVYTSISYRKSRRQALGSRRPVHVAPATTRTRTRARAPGRALSASLSKGLGLSRPRLVEGGHGTEVWGHNMHALCSADDAKCKRKCKCKCKCLALSAADDVILSWLWWAGWVELYCGNPWMDWARIFQTQYAYVPSARVAHRSSACARPVCSCVRLPGVGGPICCTFRDQTGIAVDSGSGR